jgi:methyltransferase family protein
MLSLMDRKSRSRFLALHPSLRRAALRPKTANGLADRDFEAIQAGGNFSNAWFSADTARVWLAAFGPFRDQVKSALEIGSWEGRSARFIAWLFPQARLTCIDTFAGGDEHKILDRFAGTVSTIESRFRENTAHIADRLTVLKGPSAQMLASLEGSFDFAYIDGSHAYGDVMLDTLLTWERLNKDGFMVWDDYFWTMKKVYGKRNPKLAIDQFLTAYRGNYRVLFANGQVGIQRV